MKKAKNYLLLSIIAICSFAMAGMLRVNASNNGFKLYANSPVCDPSTGLKPGDMTTCYIVGSVSSADGTSHGFGVRAYTTDGLLFKDATVTNIDGQTSQLILDPNAQSAGQGKININGDVTVTCQYDKNINITNAKNQNMKDKWMIEDDDEFKCIYFYSTSETDAFKTSVAGPNDVVKKVLGTEGSNLIMVIGTITAQIDPTITNKSDCGELCVSVVEAASKGDYTNIFDANGDYACTEVHYEAGGVAGSPNTGAFASYAVLAAGVLVAISAIAIAKKHNKIYRV